MNTRQQQREFVDLETREYDDIDAREPKFLGFLKKAAGLVLRETPEFDELD
jgi:hypothetical protein